MTSDDIRKLPIALAGACFHGEVWVICPNCNKGVEMMGMLDKHVARDGRLKAYECPHCKKYFADE